MIPFVLALLAMLAVMNGFGIIQVSRIWSWWPVSVIATGLEEIYLWAAAKTR